MKTTRIPSISVGVPKNGNCNMSFIRLLIFGISFMEKVLLSVWSVQNRNMARLCSIEAFDQTTILPAISGQPYLSVPEF